MFRKYVNSLIFPYLAAIWICIKKCINERKNDCQNCVILQRGLNKSLNI